MGDVAVALHFDLCINDVAIGYFEAVRVAGGTDPDDLNTYRIRLRGDVGAWDGEVQHRYGDRAWELVRKVLQAKRSDDDGTGLDDLEDLADVMARSTDRQARDEGGADWLQTAADVMKAGWHR
jgi:hypothetical protein